MFFSLQSFEGSRHEILHDREQERARQLITDWVLAHRSPPTQQQPQEQQQEERQDQSEEMQEQPQESQEQEAEQPEI